MTGLPTFHGRHQNPKNWRGMRMLSGVTRFFGTVISLWQLAKHRSGRRRRSGRTSRIRTAPTDRIVGYGQQLNSVDGTPVSPHGFDGRSAVRYESEFCGGVDSDTREGRAVLPAVV
jgi:hypothetical protein